MIETGIVFNKERFSKACSICFSEENIQDMLLSRYLHHSLQELSKKYMEESVHDLLNTICISCSKALIETHIFLNQCLEASHILQKSAEQFENDVIFIPITNTQFKSKLFLKRYDLKELEIPVKSYVIADHYNVTTEVEMTDTTDIIDVKEPQENVKLEIPDNGEKFQGECELNELKNDLYARKLIINQTEKRKRGRPKKKVEYIGLHKPNFTKNGKLLRKKRKIDKFEYKDDFVTEETVKNVLLRNETLKMDVTITNTDTLNNEKSKLDENSSDIKLEPTITMTNDIDYSDEDDLPLIIHRDRSLAVTVIDEVTDEITEAKIEKEDTDEFDNDYFNEENDYFDGDKLDTCENDRYFDISFKTTLKQRRKNIFKGIKSEMLICELCDRKFDNKSQYRQHRKTEHPNVGKKEYDTCEICGKQLKAMCMSTHIKNVHEGKIPSTKFLCPICGKLYNANQRRRHTMLHSTPKPYQCEHCAFRCSQRGNLRRHQRRHTGEKPYLCTVCGHGASQKGTLLDHMKSHEPLTNPVCCVFCSLEFATSYEYRRHRRVHKNEVDQRPSAAQAHKAGEGTTAVVDISLVCPVCKKQLMSESGFKCHVRAHKEAGRYRCQHCTKSFTSKATLEYHVRIHTGEKPYRCTACPARFKQPGHLTAHMAIHANRREHRCTYCDQTFNIKFNLIEHLRIHTGDTIDCEHCGKKFRHNSNRRKHIRETHLNEVKLTSTSSN